MNIFDIFYYSDRILFMVIKLIAKGEKHLGIMPFVAHLTLFCTVDKTCSFLPSMRSLANTQKRYRAHSEVSETLKMVGLCEPRTKWDVEYR